MKSSTTLISLLLFAFFMYSCTEESVNLPEQNTAELSAITEVFYLNNSPQASTTVFAISGNLNTLINYEGGSDAIQTFTNNLMTSADFYNNQGAITGTTDFEYDGIGRLMNYSYYTIDSDVTILVHRTDFEYSVNQINSTKTNYNLDGTVASVDLTDTFTLDANGLIVRYDDLSANSYWEATYNNGNLATIEVSGYGNNDGTGSFTYTNELASDAYQKEKFRFGSEWKNNIMLYNQVGSYSFKQLAETGENYLSSYTFSDLNGQPTVTLNVDYEFDDEGRLIQQTKNKMFFGVAHDRILTYTYE